MPPRTLLLPLICFVCLPAPAADEPPDLDPLIRAGQQWIAENIDQDALAALGVDVGAFENFARDLQQRFQSDYVLDLAALQPIAREWLPLLESQELTQPYAAWLRSHLDYFEVARELRQTAPTNALAWRPTAAQQRQAWQKRLQREPWPAASSNWVTQLKPRFAAAGVPAELVWLAEVESGFNPAARSPAGAVGMFQLMPATANRFGLAVNWMTDERKQADKSATASAAYLKTLHEQFNDWRLVMAAYNCGEGRVASLLKKHGVKTFDALAPHLPAETQMYVPKLEATLLKREGAVLSRLKPAIAPPGGAH